MSFGKGNIESRSSTPLSIGPQERIAYHGDLKPFLETVTANYEFGNYVGHEVKQNGYEDFNLVLQTTSGPFFVKCFANWRSKEECARYIKMIQSASKNHVTTPFIYPNLENSPLTKVSIDNTDVNLCTMQYLDGGNVWEGRHPLNTAEQTMVIQEAAKINRCDYKPTSVEDFWAITSAPETYQKNKDRLDPAERATIESLIEQFRLVDLAALPHTFVHGDIRSTNVMRHSDGKVYIIDFSVANWYPRIVELAVLLSDILFDPNNPAEFQNVYQWALNEYQHAGVTLTDVELEVLPLFVRLAHAMNVIGASSQDATNYISQEENNHWLNLGRAGLKFVTTYWNPTHNT